MPTGRLVLATLNLVLAVAILPLHAAAENIEAGWVERVRIMPQGLDIVAKLDSGAKTSSLNAPRMKQFERDGKKWVSFELTNRFGKSVEISKPIVRTVKIRRHNTPSQHRPVVLLTICVGKFYRETEVNLIDRSKFNYQLLIGRQFLATGILVNSGRTYMTKPTCRQTP